MGLKAVQKHHRRRRPQGLEHRSDVVPVSPVVYLKDIRVRATNRAKPISNGTGDEAQRRRGRNAEVGERDKKVVIHVPIRGERPLMIVRERG